MRPYFSIGVLALALVLWGCSTSHGGDSDSGGSGGDAAADAGTLSDGTGGGSGGSSGGGTTTDGGSHGGSGDDSGGGIDLVAACVDACDYLVACDPMFSRVECVADCLGTREWLASPTCEALMVDLFDCVMTLECSELIEGEITDTVCASILRGIERECDRGTEPSDPPPVEPTPAE